MKKPRILATGLTGFLGSQIRPLLEEFGEVTSLSRSDPRAISADLSFWDGRINPLQYRGKFDIFLHMAGLYNLRINQTESLRQNVMTTHSALAICQKAEIPHFVHISTIGVTVRHKNKIVGPDDLDDNMKFPDFYSSSKALTEEMVKLWSDGIESRLVLRLGILVGDTQFGLIRRIDGPYQAAYTFGKLLNFIKLWPGALPVPGTKNGRLPLVPVDCAAKAIVELCRLSIQQKWTGVNSFHLSPKEGLSAEELYKGVLNFYKIKKEIKLLQNIPVGLSKRAAEFLIDLPKEEVEYLLNLPKLDTTKTIKYLGEKWCPEFSDYEDVFWKGFENYVSNR